jgi:integrase
MAGDGAGRLLGQHAAGPEVRWGDIPGVLRIGGRALSARESAHRARIHWCPSEGRQEAGDDRALYRDDLARAYGRASTQSLLERSGAIGIEENGSRNLRSPGPGSSLGKDIKEFIDTAGDGLRADRERAMLCVAYETLACRGELVALEVRDIDFHPNGTGQAIIRRGKTDPIGQGRVAYLSRTTVRWLKIWLEHSRVEEGAVFRRLIGRAQIGGPLYSGSVSLIFKRVAQWIGMPARYVAAISGHSTRVGATQDLAALDIDLAAITQAGGWKSPRMPLQYAEKINVGRSGMARAAEKTGRDSITE